MNQHIVPSVLLWVLKLLSKRGEGDLGLAGEVIQFQILATWDECLTLEVVAWCYVLKVQYSETMQLIVENSAITTPAIFHSNRMVDLFF
jgi:hypothetical protein